jgi:hypothetical protein
MGRRLLRCNRRQEAARIDLSFDIVNPDHVITVEDKHTVFNCLAIPDHLLNPADASNLLSTYISSIELVKLVFLVLRVRDLPFAEKNRLLRAFDAFYPKTVTKTMTDAFGFLTSLPEPKPMKHLRPVRIYDWTALEQMVRKATYRYVRPSSRAPADIPFLLRLTSTLTGIRPRARPDVRIHDADGHSFVY